MRWKRDEIWPCKNILYLLSFAPLKWVNSALINVFFLGDSLGRFSLFTQFTWGILSLVGGEHTNSYKTSLSLSSTRWSGDWLYLRCALIKRALSSSWRDFVVLLLLLWIQRQKQGRWKFSTTNETDLFRESLLLWEIQQRTRLTVTHEL